jgi:flagellar protein FlbD
VIPLTRPDGSTFLVNPDRIEFVEETPDCIVTMADGKKLLVREGADEVAHRFRAYQKSIRVPESQFGGRRRSDPPASHDPSAYQHPNRAHIRLAPRVVPEEGAER